MDYPSDPKVGLHAGKFTDGSADGTINPSLDPADWANAVTDEILAVIAAAGLVKNEADTTQLSQAIAKLIAGAATAIILQSQTFAPGVVNGNPVRWDAANSRWALALADGTANDLVVGFADVTNAAVYCFGRSRAGLFAGLTVGARYYISATGTLTTAAASDTIYAGVAVAANTLFIDLDPGSSSLSGYARLAIAQTWTKAQSSTPVVIVDGASPAIDLSAANVQSWTLGANRTMPAPTAVSPGQSGVIWITPNTYTLAYNTFWQPVGGVLPTWPATATEVAMVYETAKDGSYALFALAKKGTA